MITSQQFHQKYNVVKAYDMVPRPGFGEGASAEQPRDVIDVNGNGKADFTTWTRQGADGVDRSRSHNSEPVLTFDLHTLKSMAKREGTEVLMETGTDSKAEGYQRFQVRDQEVITRGSHVITHSSPAREARKDYASFESLDSLSPASEDKTPLLPIEVFGEGAFYAMDVKNEQFLIALPRK